MASAFVFMPFLISHFGLDDYGLFLLVGSLTGYLGLLDLGVGASLIKYIAEHRARNEERALSETISTALVFYTAIGVVASLVLFAIALFGIHLLKLPSESEHLARNLFLVGGVASLFNWPISTANFVLAGLQRYDIAAKFTVAAVGVNIVVTSAVLVSGEGPLMLLIGTSVGSILVGLAIGAAAIRELGATKVALSHASWNRLRQIFRFSSTIFVMQVCSVLVYQQTDRLVLGLFVGTAAVALYEAAQKLHSLVRQFAALSASAVLPTASQLDAEDRRDALLQLFLRGTKYTVVAVTPIVVAIIVLAEPLLREWLGPEFVTMTLGVQLYVSYWLVNANIAVLSGILMGTNKLRFMLWYTVVGSLANVALSVALVQVIGINGVIVGTIAPYYLSFPIYMRYASRLLDFPLREWWRHVILPTYPPLTLTAAIAVVARLLGLTDNLIGVGIAGGLAVGAYWVSVYAFGLTQAEREDARALASAVRRRFGFN